MSEEKRKSEKTKVGRPKLKLCKDDISRLASIGCSNEDIATVLKCSADTIERNFAGACEEGRANLRNNIKKTQIDVAVKERNTSMLIWVGKQWCGQRDSRHEVEHKGDVVINVKHYGSEPPKRWSE